MAKINYLNLQSENSKITMINKKQEPAYLVKLEKNDISQLIRQKKQLTKFVNYTQSQERYTINGERKIKD